jgi:hypothetical protein
LSARRLNKHDTIAGISVGAVRDLLRSDIASGFIVKTGAPSPGLELAEVHEATTFALT